MVGLVKRAYSKIFSRFSMTAPRKEDSSSNNYGSPSIIFTGNAFSPSNSPREISNDHLSNGFSLTRTSTDRHDDLHQSQSNIVPSEMRCPYAKMGCEDDPQNSEKMSIHLHEHIYHHNKLLVDWITNIERVMFTMILNGKQDEPRHMLERTKRNVQSLVNHPLSNETKNPINPVSNNQLKRELSNVTNNFCYFARFIRDLKDIHDKEISELKLSIDRHDKELSQLKLDFRYQIDCIQKELSKAIEKSKKDDEQIRSLQIKMKKIPFRHTASLSLHSPTSTLNNENVSDVPTPSVICEIDKLNSKIGTRSEVWSKYFRSPCKKYTMRLWIHLNNVLLKDHINVELLVWDRENKYQSRFHFEGSATVSIKNKLKPYLSHYISKPCSIDEPDYSESFIFKYRDLLKMGVIDDDFITVECIVDGK